MEFSDSLGHWLQKISCISAERNADSELTEMSEWKYTPLECAMFAARQIAQIFDLTGQEIDQYFTSQGDIYHDGTGNVYITILFKEHNTGRSDDWAYAAVINVNTGEADHCFDRETLIRRIPELSILYQNMSAEQRQSVMRWFREPYGNYSSWTAEQQAAFNEQFYTK
ncbi:MAG: hypothetical protein RR975_09500 [Clostridia bacterium]